MTTRDAASASVGRLDRSHKFRSYKFRLFNLEAVDFALETRTVACEECARRARARAT